MNKLIFSKFIIFFIAGIVIFSSCTQDAVPPSLVLGTGTDYISGNSTVYGGTELKVQLKGTKADAEMKSLSIYENGSQLNLSRIVSGLNANPTVLTGTETTSFTKDVVFTAQTSGTSDYLFILEDASGSKDSVGFTITLKAETAFNVVNANLKVYNADGPTGYFGSVDLQAGATVASTSTSGDVQDFGINTSDTGWQKKIKPENGTEMYIPSGTVDFDKVTSLEKLVEVLNNSTKVTEASVAIGKIFVFKSPSSLSGTYDYFVIKTLDLKETTSDNLDYYIFSLKGRKN